MARYLFGEGAMDHVIAPPSSSPPLSTTDGVSVPGVVIARPNVQVLVSLDKGGTPVTDLADPDGTPVTEVFSDGNGRYAFQGPDEVKVLWLSGDGGETWFQAVSSEILAKVDAYRDPFYLLEAAETEPPPGTPADILVYRKQT